MAQQRAACCLHLQVGNKQFGEVLMDVRGPAAAEEWDRLQEHMRPLAKASTILPPVAFR
jgi:hypothetical protein